MRSITLIVCHRNGTQTVLQNFPNMETVIEAMEKSYSNEREAHVIMSDEEGSQSMVLISKEEVAKAVGAAMDAAREKLAELGLLPKSKTGPSNLPKDADLTNVVHFSTVKH